MKTSSHKLPGLRRWVRFNAVGTLGFGVQICVAYFLIAATNEPLLATALAVETAVLHNFSWHYFLVWKDQRQGKCADFLRRLLAFNATNGMVSLTGNLLFAWLIVERQHASAILANFLAIATCSLINFILCDKVVFRIATNRCYSSGISTSMHRAVRVIALVIVCYVVSTVTTRAQDAASPKFTLFGGPGIIRTQAISRGEVQAGVSLDEALPDAGEAFHSRSGILVRRQSLTSVQHSVCGLHGSLELGTERTGTDCKGNSLLVRSRIEAPSLCLCWLHETFFWHRQCCEFRWWGRLSA
jgi:putative flippase GtrA